jgi:hypothetical protein
MDLFSTMGSSFILIKRDWLDYQLYRLVRIIFAAVFYYWLVSEVCQRFKRKMEVYCDDFDVWDFIPAFRYSANWNWQFGNIDTKFTPLNTLVLGALVLALVLKEDRFGVF